MRHRIVQSANRRELESVIEILREDGWRPLGSPAIAAPDDLRHTPYWVAVLYQSRAPVRLEILQILPPSDSQFSIEPSAF